MGSGAPLSMYRKFLRGFGLIPVSLSAERQWIDIYFRVHHFKTVQASELLVYFVAAVV